MHVASSLIPVEVLVGCCGVGSRSRLPGQSRDREREHTLSAIEREDSQITSRAASMIRNQIDFGTTKTLATCEVDAIGIVHH